MEPRDYLPVAAIVISLLSFGVSAWNVRFSRRAKLSELRAAVLCKAAELSARLTRIAELNADMKLHAQFLQDFEGLEHLERRRTEQLRNHTNLLYGRLSATPSSHGLDVYESFFHEFHELSDSAMRLEQTIQNARDRYLLINALPQEPA